MYRNSIEDCKASIQKPSDLSLFKHSVVDCKQSIARIALGAPATIAAIDKQG